MKNNDFETVAIYEGDDEEPTYLTLHKQFSIKEFEKCYLSLINVSSKWVILNHSLLSHTEFKRKIFWYSWN